MSTDKDIEILKKCERYHARAEKVESENIGLFSNPLIVSEINGKILMHKEFRLTLVRIIRKLSEEIKEGNPI